MIHQAAQNRCLLPALALTILFPVVARATSFSWISPSGQFNTAASWTQSGLPVDSDGIPDANDTTTFARGNVTLYPVYFGNLLVPNSDIHPTVDKVIIGNNPLSFVGLYGSTLTVDSTNITETARGVVIGSGAGDVAALTSTLTTFDTQYATLGSAAGSSGTLNLTSTSAGAFSVSGTGATYDLIVGLNGTGTINVTNGRNVTVADDTVLGQNASGVGNVSVGGAGSTWTNTGDLNVGLFGSGTLTVEAGAEVINAIGYLGNNAGSTGSATITGAATVWRNLSGLFVGYSGNATLNLTTGGDVISATTSYIGYNSGSIGVANVSTVGGGNLSRLVINGELFVGYAGTGSLNVTDGSYVQHTNAYLGQDVSGDGSATVSGVDSEWNNLGTLIVANAGVGMLNIAAAGVVKNTTGTIGDDAGSIGEVTVDGLGSTWTNSGDLHIGNLGQATLTIQNNGLVSVAGNSSINNLSTVNLAGGTLRTNSLAGFDRINWTAGTLHLTAMDVPIDSASQFGNSLTIGPDKTLLANKNDGHHTVSDLSGAMLIASGGKADFSGGSLYVGEHAGEEGSLQVINGGEFDCTILFIARESGSAGSVVIDGPNSNWTNTAPVSNRNFHVGYEGDGSLEILNGGRIEFGLGNRNYVGRKDGATGLLRVDGVGSTLAMPSSPLAVGGDISQSVGGGGTGRLEITSGGRVETFFEAHVGYGNGSTGSVLVSGVNSMWEHTGYLYIGNSNASQLIGYSHGSLTINSGGQVSSSLEVIIAATGGDGMVTVDGAGSVLSGPIVVGGNAPGSPAGGFGVLEIINGADALSSSAGVGGIARIDGPGSTWNVDDNLSVTGGGGYGGRLEVVHSGYLQSQTAAIGQLNEVTPSSIIVDGVGSMWTNVSDLYIAEDASSRGTLEITNGGHAEVAFGDAIVGYFSGAVGTVSVSGSASLWDVQGELHLGSVNHGGSGLLHVTGGGEVRSERAYISTFGFFGDEVISTATVDGVDSTWLNSGNLYVGYSGSVGVLDVANGGSVESSQVIVESLGELRGDGNIVGNVQNGGLVSPGTSPGVLNIDGSYMQTTIGDLLIELAPSSYDQLLVTGDATLAGTLTVSLLDGFIPSVGQSFTFLTADDVDDAFVSEVFPSVPNLAFDVIYNVQSVVLTVFSALPGDYNGDGTVDAADYIVWRKNVGAATLNNRDPNGMGPVGQADRDFWRVHFGETVGSGAGAGANAVVPEPATLVLLMFAAAGWCLRRGRAA